MAFSDFRYPEVLQRFGLRWNSVMDMFADAVPVQPSEPFHSAYQRSVPLGANAHTEFARAVWVVGPILAEFWKRYHHSITLTAGADLQVPDAPELSGRCDFLISGSHYPYVVMPPVHLVGFMSPGDDWVKGLGRCIAALVAAQHVNGDGNPVFGFITNGTEWHFLRLRGAELDYDLGSQICTDASYLLGILTHIVGPPPAQVAA